MSRQSDAKALAAIAEAGPHGASALVIGRAVMRGEKRQHYIARSHKEALGLSIGTALTRRGLVTVTRGNRFVLPSCAAQGQQWRR